MSEPTWFLRNKGQVTGPFTRDQLESLRNRGLLNRFSEVSTDRKAWSKAAESDASNGAKAASPVAADTYDVPQNESATNDPRDAYNWYYAVGKTPAGPVKYSELRQFAASGKISAKTKVWNETMADWERAGQVTDFGFAAGGGGPPDSSDHHAPVVAARAAAPSAAVPGATGQFEDLPPFNRLALTGFKLSLSGWILAVTGPLISALIIYIMPFRPASVCLLLGALATFFCYLIGLILSSIGTEQAARLRPAQRGVALGTAGIILGAIGVCIAVFALGMMLMPIATVASQYDPIPWR